MKRTRKPPPGPPRKRNAPARALADPRYHKRVVPKVGAYKRRPKHVIRPTEGEEG